MLPLSALSETIRFAEQLHNLGMVSETIEQGSGQAFVAKDLHPIGKFEVGGDDQSEAFVQFRAEGKQGLRAVGGEGDKAQLIQNDQVQFEGGGDEAMQAMFILGLE